MKMILSQQWVEYSPGNGMIALGGVRFMAKVRQSGQSDSRKGGNGKLVVIIVAIVAVIVILVGIILFLLLRPKEEPERRNVVVTEDNVNEVVEQMGSAEVTPPGYYTVTMNNEWTFATGDAVSEDAYVENVVGNTNDVYFDVFLVGDEENAIYKSPIIPIGSSLNQIALDTPLEAGTHDCVVIYHLVDEDQNTLSTLRVAIKITVNN